MARYAAHTDWVDLTAANFGMPAENVYVKFFDGLVAQRVIGIWAEGGYFRFVEGATPEKPQLDIRPAHGNEGIHPREAALGERFTDRRADFRLRSRRAVLLRQRNDERLFNDDAAAARAGHRHASFFCVPFQC